MTQASRAGTLTIANNGKIMLCNQVACAMLGYTEKELMRLELYDLMPKDTHYPAMHQMWLKKRNLSGNLTRPCRLGVTVVLQGKTKQMPVTLFVRDGDGSEDDNNTFSNKINQNLDAVPAVYTVRFFLSNMDAVLEHLKLDITCDRVRRRDRGTQYARFLFLHVDCSP